MLERVRVNYKDIEDLKDFIYTYLEESAEYDFYGKFIRCDCNTDRGTQSWYELEVDSMPDDVEFVIKNIPEKEEQKIADKIASFINNELKFYKEVECYKDGFCENVIVKPIVYEASRLENVLKISIGFEVF